MVVDGSHGANIHHVSIFTVGTDWAIEGAERIDCLSRRVSRRS